MKKTVISLFLLSGLALISNAQTTPERGIVKAINTNSGNGIGISGGIGQVGDNINSGNGVGLAGGVGQVGDYTNSGHEIGVGISGGVANIDDKVSGSIGVGISGGVPNVADRVYIIVSEKTGQEFLSRPTSKVFQEGEVVEYVKFNNTMVEVK